MLPPHQMHCFTMASLFAGTLIAATHATYDTDTVVLVDTIPLLRSCVSAIARTTSLAVDIEGVALCRSGTLCIIQLKAKDSSIVWLVDVVVLGARAFTEVALGGMNLKGILESQSIEKLFFDVRNDSDALYNLFDISLANVYDLQLLELAVRSSKPGARLPRFLRGLVPSLEEHVAPTKSAAVVRSWARVKEAGLRLFAPEHGGQYQVFCDRPLAHGLLEYCAQDVALLHDLQAAMHFRLGSGGGGNWENRIRAQSMVRVGVALQRNYVPRGPEKAMAPTYW
ncbi:ribonuclease H-like domain-containing protein [Mycena amicta]|nr:ribonuclease H-like domain-containing protein [Mycena amicta]